jgi:hypothetical protein
LVIAEGLRVFVVHGYTIVLVDAGERLALK